MPAYSPTLLLAILLLAGCADTPADDDDDDITHEVDSVIYWGTEDGFGEHAVDRLLTCPGRGRRPKPGARPLPAEPVPVPGRSS